MASMLSIRLAVLFPDAMIGPDRLVSLNTYNPVSKLIQSGTNKTSGSTDSKQTDIVVAVTVTAGQSKIFNPKLTFNVFCWQKNCSVTQTPFSPWIQAHVAMSAHALFYFLASLFLSHILCPSSFEHSAPARFVPAAMRWSPRFELDIGRSGQLHCKMIALTLGADPARRKFPDEDCSSRSSQEINLCVQRSDADDNSPNLLFPSYGLMQWSPISCRGSSLDGTPCFATVFMCFAFFSPMKYTMAVRVVVLGSCFFSYLVCLFTRVTELSRIYFEVFFFYSFSCLLCKDTICDVHDIVLYLVLC